MLFLNYSTNSSQICLHDLWRLIPSGFLGLGEGGNLLPLYENTKAYYKGLRALPRLCPKHRRLGKWGLGMDFLFPPPPPKKAVFWMIT